MDRREFLRQMLGASAILAASGTAEKFSRHTRRMARRPAPRQPGPLNPAGLPGRVILPGQSEYDAAAALHNGRLASHPAAIVFCANARDIQQAIQWAVNRHIPLRARCGRHSYEGYSSVNGGLVIDVSDMKAVQFDPATSTVWAGAGLRLGDLYEALWTNKMTVPGGSCPTVGLAGLTLGGGYGLSARHLGLTCDSLRAVEMVLADGSVVNASPTSHPDLFWACRGGGGGNFGIATRFLFHAYPVDQVAIYNMTWDWHDMETVLDTWQHWAPTADSRLTSVLKIKSEADGSLASVGQFAGTSAEINSLLAPLRAAGTPHADTVQDVSAIDAVRIFAGQKPGQAHWGVDWASEHNAFKHSSDYAAKPLGPHGIAALRRALASAPSVSLVQIEAYGGAINNLSPTATAFAHRAGTLFSLQYQSYWKHGTGGSTNIAWVAAARAAMRASVTGAAYANYCDSAIPHWLHAYYGPNLARLERVKARYDPHGVFQFPQSIPAS